MKLNNLYSLLIIFFSIASIKAQTPVYEMDVVNGTIVNTCGGLFTDSSPGSSHYGDNENFQVTFCSNNGTDLLNFNFGSGSNLTNERIHPSDTLYIYDGIGTSGTLLAAVSGNPLNTNKIDVLGASTGDFLSLSSCITFVFVSDGANNEDGWAAGITCVPLGTCSGNPPASDLFGGAPFICNFDDYCGTTSASFGEDYPGNLLGNTGGACPGPLFGGTLENNSWLQFEASATDVSFDVSVTNCGTDGIQIAIFDYDPSTGNFTRMSPCALSDGGNSGNFTLTGTGLVTGNNYYIMVDGNAGAVCDYSISANTGIAIANAGPDQVVCGTAILAAEGTGSWSVVSGSGIFADPTNPTTTVSGLSSSNIFRWTTSSTACGIVSDEVIISNSCPCSITQLTTGNQTNCSPATNTYTQEIIITYSNPPTSGNILINGQSFAITSSPQTVTLTNLTANGVTVNVSASFSADAGCSATQNALFVSPAACSGTPCTPDNGTWD